MKCPMDTPPHHSLLSDCLRVWWHFLEAILNLHTCWNRLELVGTCMLVNHIHVAAFITSLIIVIGGDSFWNIAGYNIITSVSRMYITSAGFMAQYHYFFSSMTHHYIYVTWVGWIIVIYTEQYENITLHYHWNIYVIWHKSWTVEILGHWFLAYLT